MVNHFGRISVRAQPFTDDPVLPGKLTATGSTIGEKEIKVNASSGRAVVTVDPSDSKKRIDLTLISLLKGRTLDLKQRPEQLRS